MPGKAMIVNLVSLVNELVNGLNGQLKMVKTLAVLWLMVIFCVGSH